MTLADAIRLGAMLGPPGHGGWMDGPELCALAGASLAVGLPPITIPHAMTGQPRPCVCYERLAEQFPILTRPALHPVPRAHVGMRGDLTVQDVIWSLNDCYNWTREQIAAWVEIEAAAPQAARAAAPDLPPPALDPRRARLLLWFPTGGDVFDLWYGEL